MPNVLRRRRLLFRPTGLAYLLREDFDDAAAAAPLSSPRVCRPGPGLLTLADSGSKLSLSAGRLQVAGGLATPTWGDPGVWGGALARVPGRASVWRANMAGTAGHRMVGWGSAQSGILDVGLYYDAGAKLSPYLASTGATGSVGSYSAGVDYDAALVLRGAGGFLALRGGAFASWTLLWVFVTGTTSPLYPGLAVHSQASALDNFRALDLGGSWASDYGLATQRLAGSQAAGTTFTHTADCLAEFTVTTRPTAGSVLVFFRRQDASNYWQVEVNSAGDFLLKEVVAGTPTTRATAAAVVSSGQRCVVIADAATVNGYSNNTLQWTYASASNFQTATAGQLNALGTGGVVSDIIAWPRNVSGFMPSGL